MSGVVWRELAEHFEREPNGREYEKRYAASREELPLTVHDSGAETCSGQ